MTITQHIFDHLKKKAIHPVLLSPDKTQKAGAVDNRWKVFVNHDIESDI